jgi:hypothetical protein
MIRWLPFLTSRRGWLAAVVLVGCLARPVTPAAPTSAGGSIPPPAPSPPHWAYLPLRPVTPPQSPAQPPGHPVDAFIRARLAQAGWNPAPAADRRTLLRRVTFDLTGLPPTPEELTAFVEDADPHAYERVVDRLLASPRHGERWARHWLDTAHFAETHGHDQDRIRTNAWPYRDYLIRSFNQDVPYARFVQEQVAGDVLFPSDPQATVALGFIAAGPWDESSLRDIREDTLDRQIGRYLDRDDMVATVMTVFNSTTVHCARCHDHKFDPVSQRDYYALQAVFAGVERADRVFDADADVHRRRQGLLHDLRRVARGETNLLLSPGTEAVVARWAQEQQGAPIRWQPVPLQTFLAGGGAELKRQPDGSLLALGKTPERDSYTVTSPAPDFPLTGIRLEVLPDPSLPHQGPGRNAQNGNFHLSEFQLLLFEPGQDQPRRLALTHPTADFEQDGWGIGRAVDGNDQTAWGIHPEEGKAHRASFELQEPLRAAPGSTLVFTLRQLHGEGHLLGRFRLSWTDSPGPIRTLHAEVEGWLAQPAGERDALIRSRLATFVLRERHLHELAALPAPSRVYAAAADFAPDGGLRPSLTPRRVQVLRRGEITQPLEDAQPGALACLPGLPARLTVPDGAEEGARRAALATWLTDPDNALTWRSIVNRTWQQHFGRGLCDTPNDFGRMGSTPTHPELLDWLAVWFRDEARGSFKQLHRLLVTSATYQQSSRPANAAALEEDPENRWWGRMNRLRLDAECVRDAVLQVSGRLDLRMGGPGDRQFDLQPGIHVTPKVDYTKFDVDSDAGRRRSIYRFLFRTLPDPLMDALDCPAGDQLMPGRQNAVTLQQALALWNSAFVARQAEHLAVRLTAEAPDLAGRLARASELVWGRPATPSEANALATYASEHGLANTCRLLFNSNEFVFLH